MRFFGGSKLPPLRHKLLFGGLLLLQADVPVLRDTGPNGNRAAMGFDIECRDVVRRQHDRCRKEKGINGDEHVRTPGVRTDRLSVLPGYASLAPPDQGAMTLVNSMKRSATAAMVATTSKC